MTPTNNAWAVLHFGSWQREARSQYRRHNQGQQYALVSIRKVENIMKCFKGFVGAALLCCVAMPALAAPLKVSGIRNVIILIPDGMSVGGTTLARWVQGGKPLALDEMASGL